MADDERLSDQIAFVKGEPRFLKLQAGDWRAFRDQSTGALRETLDLVEDVTPHPDSEAWVYRRDGMIRGIGALTRLMPWRWILWSFPGELSMADWKRILRFTRLRVAGRFDTDPACRRIEATANVEAPGASLLLQRLGFRLEGVMRCYGPHGEASRLYAITRGGAD